ncbi:adenosine kinase [bacterium]|nr:adenosine kinase [bacterium]
MSSTKKYAVSSVCNALMDIVVEAEDKDIKHFDLSKGIMHLVNHEKQNELLAYLKGHEQTVELGGSSMNAIRTLAQLGKETVFAGMVSEDDFGDRIRTRLGELNIHYKLGVGEGGTGTCVVLVTPDGERTMNTCLGASRMYGGDIIPHEEIAESEVFHFCGYQWDTAGQKEGIKAAMATAEKSGTKISFDIADPFIVDLNKEDFADIISKHADIVFANEEEAKLLYGASPEETAEKIAKTGAIAVVKLGAKGAIVRSGDDVFKIDPVATDVKDTTAAGDMFAAGFLHGYTSGKPLDECGHIAASLASDVISRYGAKVSDEAIKKFMK